MKWWYDSLSIQTYNQGTEVMCEYQRRQKNLKTVLHLSLKSFFSLQGCLELTNPVSGKWLDLESNKIMNVKGIYFLQ